MPTYLIPTPRERLIAFGKVLFPPLGGTALFLTARLYDRHAADLPLCEQLPWMWFVVVMVTTVMAGLPVCVAESPSGYGGTDSIPRPALRSSSARACIRAGGRTRTPSPTRRCRSFFAVFLVAFLSMFVFPDGGPLNLGLQGCEP